MKAKIKNKPTKKVVGVEAKVIKLKPGDKVYVGSAYYCSRGSQDFDGGLCEIDKVEIDNDCKNEYNQIMVRVKERPGVMLNYKYLIENQKQWKKEYGKRKGKMNPDEDRPWIEDGDIVNGEVYHGDPIR
jgi:hypothetical protein